MNMSNAAWGTPGHAEFSPHDEQLENSRGPAKGRAGDIPVYCAFDAIVELADLRPNPKNPNQHPDSQIELLAKVIRAQGWRAPVTVSTRSGLIVRGHGRYMAAKIIGCPAPVDYQHYESEEAELADLVADNRLAELAEIDETLLAEIVASLDESDFDTELTGYDSDMTAALLGEIQEAAAEAELYSAKVDTPVYEITGDTPELDELYSTFKLRELLEDIETDGSISDDEKEFLRLAGYRHVVFDYSKIAEYYAAASAPMQRLMEDSALVIIDFNKAIEHGYVKLREGVAGILRDVQEAEQNEA